MMVEKNRTIVKIGGREYTMRGVESEEYIHRVAILVDRKMEEIGRMQPNLSTTQVAVLTAINLGDEVLKLRDDLAKLQEELNTLRDTRKFSGSPSPAQGSQSSAASPSPAIYEVSRKGKR